MNNILGFKPSDFTEAASKIKTFRGLATVAILIIGYLVIYLSNVPLMQNLVMLIGGVFGILLIVFMAAVVEIKIIEWKERESDEPIRLSSDLRVRTEVWSILCDAFSKLGFVSEISDSEELIGMSLDFSWAKKGDDFSLFIAQLKANELTVDAIWQLIGMRDSLKGKRDGDIKILIISEITNISEGIFYDVKRRTDLFILMPYAIKQIRQDPNFLEKELNL